MAFRTARRRLRFTFNNSIMSCIITFASGKGGVAKSTGSLATAGLLARSFRVGFVDLDPDAYSTTMGLSQRAHDDPLSAQCASIQHALITSGRLMLFPGGGAMDSATELDVKAHIARCAAQVDFLVIDTPPDRRRPTVHAALRAASVIVIPVMPEFQALAGLEKLLETCRHLGVTAPVRAILSRWNGQTVLARDVLRDLVTAHPGVALSTIIPRDQRAAEAPAAGLPVTLYAPRSPSALAYRTAVYEIAATGGVRIPKEAL
jgi:chromosome partitioning protein